MLVIPSGVRRSETETNGVEESPEIRRLRNHCRSANDCYARNDKHAYLI